jgi:hypothetical protein
MDNADMSEYLYANYLDLIREENRVKMFTLDIPKVNGISIMSKSKLLTANTIQDIINILPNRYKRLNVNIYVIRNIFDLFRYFGKHFALMISSLVSYIFNKETKGYYQIISKSIVLYQKRIYDNSTDNNFWPMFVLIHELAHAYQFQFKKNFSSIADTNDLERDANKFTFRYMIRHRKDIENILSYAESKKL